MEKHLSFEDIIELEKQKRTNLVNSCGGFKSVCLIATCDSKGQKNVAPFNSLVHIGASPPLIGFIIRPDSVERHTLMNILETGYFTINHLNEGIYRQAHQASARYAKEISEFEAVGLRPIQKDDFPAPYVMESIIKMGVTFRERVNIYANGTILIIGHITHLYFPDDCLTADAFLDLEKATTITCSGLDCYHRTQKIERLSYAKTDKNLTTIG